LTQREPFPIASQSLITLERKFKCLPVFVCLFISPHPIAYMVVIIIAYKRGQKSLDEQVIVLQTTARKLLSFLKELQLPESTLQQLNRFITDAGDDPGELADMLTGTIDASHDDRLRVLSAVQLDERLALVTELLTRQIHASISTNNSMYNNNNNNNVNIDLLQSLSISQKIHSTVEGNLSKKQREFYLRQQVIIE
jgi:ATP-dependent Lon protease